MFNVPSTTKLVRRQGHDLTLILSIFFCSENFVCFLCLLHIFRCTSGYFCSLKGKQFDLGPYCLQYRLLKCISR